MRGTVVWTVLVALGLSAPARANDPIDEDLAEVSAAIEARPTDARLRRVRVSLWLDAERANEAVLDLDVLDALTGDPSATRLLRAEAEALRGRDEAALALLDAHLAHASDPAAYDLRAAVFARLGEHERAAQDWAAAFYAAPTVVRAMGRIDALRSLHRDAEVIRACREALATIGESVMVRWELVESLERVGAPDEALRALDAAPRLAPVRRGLHRARLLVLLGRSAEATLQLAQTHALAFARARRRPSLGAWREAALVAHALGRADDASEAERHVAVLAPSILGGAR
ncbi:MAG: hypothetical protein KC586_27600 [Myxococcales bacterium]|nr:hypothetical protein [Myxococcales bacterium]